MTEKLKKDCNLKLLDVGSVVLSYNHEAHAEFEVDHSIRSRLIMFTADILRYTVTLTFDPLTLSICIYRL